MTVGELHHMATGTAPPAATAGRGRPLRPLRHRRLFLRSSAERGARLVPPRSKPQLKRAVGRVLLAQGAAKLLEAHDGRGPALRYPLCRAVQCTNCVAGSCAEVRAYSGHRVHIPSQPECTSLDEGQILAGLNCRRAPLVPRHVHRGQHGNADHEFESHSCCGRRLPAGLWHVGPIPSSSASDEMLQAVGPFVTLRHSEVGGPVGS